YPADVQQKIRAGEAAVGFTAEQARMALGEPARTYARTTEQGQAEVWAYRSKAPSLSVGVGVGGGGGSTRVGGGVGVSTGDRREDRLRLVFRDGRVIAVEQVRR